MSAMTPITDDVLLRVLKGCADASPLYPTQFASADSLDRPTVDGALDRLRLLGLVEMTRKRNRESLQHILCEACPSCEGRGFVKTAETVCHQIFREIVRQHRQFEVHELLILARPEVIERLLDEESAVVAELQEQIQTPIRLQSEGMFAPDQYDVVPM